jgi:hypothetical protein
MSRIHPECADSDPSERSAAAAVILRKERDEEEEDENEDEDDGNEDEDTDGYSVGSARSIPGTSIGSRIP